MADVTDVRTGSGKVGKIVGGIIALIVIIIVLAQSMTTVTAGHTGVVLTFGQVSPTVLSEGLHFKIPFVQQIVLVDNRVQKAEVACSSASKDMQTVSATIALNYKVRNANSAEIYQTVGTNFEQIIVNPAIQECVKAVTAKYTAEQLITERQIIGDQMKELLDGKISRYGLDIELFNIISFDFTAEYNAAIEAKQTAQQNALKAEQDLQRIKVEAEQTIAKAQAEAEAYRLKSEQLTPQMIAMEYIDKWDGKLPAVAGGDSAMMFDISEIIKEAQNTAPSASPSAAPAPVTPKPEAAAEDDNAEE